ncbi:hypothetical protein R1sor_013906 [Riccia sorocarpa]|uniref:BPL/LPL catalytic domain-containing protein n=1 Tax=Riccia sorocarpa TaxID=122646 RepID=A0ABD3HAX5_9MARC
MFSKTFTKVHFLADSTSVEINPRYGFLAGRLISRVTAIRNFVTAIHGSTKSCTSGEAPGQERNACHPVLFNLGNWERVRHVKTTLVKFRTERLEKSTIDSTSLKEVGKVDAVPGEGKLPSHADLIHALSGNRDLKLPEGAEMVSLALPESTGARLRELFDTSLYLQSLRASEFGAFVLYSPVIPSTHTLLSQNFHALPQGTICIAGAQLQGKGRAGNVWESPKGCLMFSFTMKMTSGRLLPFLQYVVSLAVIEGLEETCNSKGIPAPEVRIKWPNDLYAKGLKIGGVLCTSTYSCKTFNIVVGVGLNVGNRKPTTCLDALIQELDPRAANLRQEELLAFIMSRFEELNGTFSTDGFPPLQESYYSRWLHSGQTVTLEEKDPKSSQVSHVPVTIRGLTPSGYLLATDAQGEQYELHPDGNSFDFLKGLVRAKLSS